MNDKQLESDQHSSHDEHDTKAFASALNTVQKPRAANGEQIEKKPLNDEISANPEQTEKKLEIVKLYLKLGSEIIIISVVCILLVAGYRLALSSQENIQAYYSFDSSHVNINFVDPEKGVYTRKFDMDQYAETGKKVGAVSSPFGNAIYLSLNEEKENYGNLARVDLINNQITEVNAHDIQFISENVPAQLLLLSQRRSEIQADGSHHYTYKTLVYSPSEEKTVFDLGSDTTTLPTDWWSKDFLLFLQEGSDRIYIADFNTSQKIDSGVNKSEVGFPMTLSLDRKFIYFSEMDNNHQPIVCSMNIETREKTVISQGDNFRVSPDGTLMLITGKTSEIIILNIETQEKTVVNDATLPFWISEDTFTYYDKLNTVHFYKLNSR